MAKRNRRILFLTVGLIGNMVFYGIFDRVVARKYNISSRCGHWKYIICNRYGPWKYFLSTTMVFGNILFLTLALVVSSEINYFRRLQFSEMR